MASIYCEELDGECFTGICDSCEYNKNGNHKSLPPRHKTAIDDIIVKNMHAFSIQGNWTNEKVLAILAKHFNHSIADLIQTSYDDDNDVTTIVFFKSKEN